MDQGQGYDPNAPRVAPLPRFRSLDEFGNRVESTRPLSNHRLAEPQFFYCPERVASMHRTDGKKIPFVHHICETDVVSDIEYLVREIDDYENPYVRRATPQEIQAHLMRKDPKGAMRKELLADPALRKQIEASVRGDLEAQIRAQLREEMGLPAEAWKEVDPDQLALDNLDGHPLDVAQGTGVAVVGASQDVTKVAGTSMVERLKAIAAAKQVAGGTLVMGGVTPQGVMTHGGSPLRPVSSADLGGAAEGSVGSQS